MHSTTIINAFLAATLATTAFAAPSPKKDTKPISPEVLQKLKDNGLARREPKKETKPISPEVLEKLKNNGLASRENELEARDEVLHCGFSVDISGKKGGRVGGKGRWIPIEEFTSIADKFCEGYVGTDIAKNRMASDTYATKMTNQETGGKDGKDANLVFTIFNTEKSGTYVVSYESCMDAMKKPLTSKGWEDKNKDELKVREVFIPEAGVEKRDGDVCYGKKYKDYEGGYTKINGVGAFGCEIQS